MSDTTAPSAAAPPKTKPPNNLIGVAILAVCVACAVALQLGAGPIGPLTFGFVLAGWILAVMAHEFGHALVGYLGGDWTVKAKGYLAFDPRRYGDLGTSLVIPILALLLGGVGFPGGAVYLRTDLMRSAAWRSAASLAGPFATLIVLLLLALILRIWWTLGASGPLFPALSVLAFLQAMALILNLLPIPGLDGFNAIRPFLPRRWGRVIRKAEGLSLLLLLALIFLIPGASAELFSVAAELGVALGLSPQALQYGWGQFQFWR
ncbi:site-2 protease family protein [Phenylobacterium sp.]|uniref:site-2 protease family protein n=1 Tax=Phenylobacterium sp. TaxID=1871053 RepID=UPI002F93310B